MILTKGDIVPERIINDPQPRLPNTEVDIISTTDEKGDVDDQDTQNAEPNIEVPHNPNDLRLPLDNDTNSAEESDGNNQGQLAGKISVAIRRAQENAGEARKRRAHRRNLRDGESDANDRKFEVGRF